MEEWQRKLIKNRVAFVKNLDQIEDLLDILNAEEVLAPSAVEKINNMKDRSSQARSLLDHINRRPGKDFDKFVNALCVTNNGDLADLLKAGVSARYAPSPKPHPSIAHNVNRGQTQTTLYRGGVGPDVDKRAKQIDEDDRFGSVLGMGIPYSGEDDAAFPEKYVFPEKWPDPERLQKDVYVHPASSARMRKIYEEHTQAAEANNVYYMMGQPRGRAVIVSNDEFVDDRYNRQGNDRDESRIVELLKQLGFDVDILKNKSEEELMVALGMEARMGPVMYNCFVMVFLSHGERDTIMTADNKLVEFLNIMKLFDSSYCNRFAGKPKIFLVQACQGKAHDIGYLNEIPSMAEVTERFAGIEIGDVENPLEQNDADPVPQQKTAAFSDMMLAVATVPGFVSWRNTALGTWFIQAIIEIFSNCAREDHVLEMLTKVNNLVGRSQTSTGKVQVSNMSFYTLKKSVYLFPGL